MRKLWKCIFIACLLCQLARRFFCAQESLLNWEGDLGVDMCPECRPLPPLIHRRAPENLHEDDLGVDMCPEQGQPMSVGGNHPVPILGRDSTALVTPLIHTKIPENLHEEDLGVDMCPEQGQPMSVGGNNPDPILGSDPTTIVTPLIHGRTPENLHEEDLGVDMCPEKGQQMSVGGNCPGPILGMDSTTSVRPLIHAETPESLHEEDLGVDMFPEKGQPMSVGGNYPGPILESDSNTLVTPLMHTRIPETLHVEDLGADMCPEKGQQMSVGGNYPGPILEMDSTTSVRPLIHAETPESLHEEDLGVDMFPEKGQPMSVGGNYPGPILGRDSTTLVRPLIHARTPENLHEEDLGVDMFPEKRQPMSVGGNDPGPILESDSNTLVTPLMHTRILENLHVEDLGVDMCPEKGQPMSGGGNYPGSILGRDSNTFVTPLMHTRIAENLHEEDLGVDMCPEKGQPMSGGGNYPGPILGRDSNTFVTPLMHTRIPENLHEEDLGADMCPEKGQPMSGGGNYPGPILGTDSNTLVKELQKLVKAQQLQIDQLGDLLRNLETRSRVDLGSLDFPGETPRDKDSNAKFSHDDFPDHEQKEDLSSLHLAECTEQQITLETGEKISSLHLAETSEQQNTLETNEKIGSTQGEIGVVLMDGEGQSESTAGGMLIVPYRPSWSEHFSLLSAVKVDGEVSCINVLPLLEGERDTRYVVGDMKGELYIFLWLGDLLLHYPTTSTAPITAMLSYTLQKTETILVTGHADGGVLVHQIWDPTEPGSGLKDGRAKISSIRTLHSLIPPSPQSFRANTGERDDGDGGTKVSMYGREANESVVNLEMFKVGKMRYTVVVDKSGKIQLFRDNGSLHGVAQAPSQPLAFMRNPNAQRLVFLTQNGVGTLDLRSMQVRSSVCLDLNSTIVTAYAFDAVGRSKANGFTAEGDLVSVVLKGEMLNFECHVKKKRQLETPGPFAPLALKGYLVAVSPDNVLVFNTTSQTGFSYANIWVEGPRLIFSVPLKEIALSFLKTPISQSHWPVVASNRDRVIVLGFGCGYVGVFRSHLPIKPADFSAKFSNTSVLISGLVLLAMWQLLNRKRGAVAVNPPMPSSSTPGDGKADTVRLGIIEREKVVEPRRFKSPTRGYVVANPTPFGSSSRNFMVTDTDTYSTRREPLFASNQPVGELEPRQ